MSHLGCGELTSIAAKALSAHSGSNRDESFHATMVNVGGGKGDGCSRKWEMGTETEDRKRKTGC
jgi:hypothetical protein